jgi:hypothetical protein
MHAPGAAAQLFNHAVQLRSILSLQAMLLLKQLRPANAEGKRNRLLQGAFRVVRT